MKIGNIDLGDRPLLLAPMEDVTDIGFRKLCREQGAAMVYSEFVAAEALVRDVRSTIEKMQIVEDERPVGVQIYGRQADDVVEAARIVESQVHPDVIDLNFGCPVKKVAGKGAGAGMLRNVPLLLEITERVVKAVNTPVTVKTRLGWDEQTKLDAALSIPGAGHRPFIVELAERLQDCGIKALTIHGRTRAQMYTGDADWSFIGMVKDNPRMTIPIIGNGDIKSVADAEEHFDSYGVDAVMIGRATFGQPWLFNRRELTLEEKMDLLRQQLKINIERCTADGKARRDGKSPELGGIIHTRRHLAATPLFKGIPDFRQTRIGMLRAETVDELLHYLDEAEKRVKASPIPILQTRYRS